MIQSIAFLTYAVSDIKAARHFYEDILGLSLTHEAGDEWFEYDVGDTTFAISAADAEHPVPVRGAVLAFEVSDLDAGGCTSPTAWRNVSARNHRDAGLSLCYSPRPRWQRGYHPQEKDISMTRRPNLSLQRTRPSRSGCNPRVPRAGSLSLGR